MPTRRRMQRMRWVTLISLVTAGCALHYYDPSNGAEHVWGVGHLVMKVSASAGKPSAAVLGCDVGGIAIHKDDQGSGVTLGWSSRRRVEILKEGTVLSLEWPDASLLNLRIGDKPRFGSVEPMAPERTSP